ncbi:hypothetical protein FDH70_gp12 [Pseudomonas phage PaMx25]|uniref:Uncharacterized protein n=1 Tax=Pseudomonas phage PaMx25 TaxID=1175654 RepID=A0A0S0MXG5_9CAUD|nr:hypothetical protein FDH70_gp12 [Pseudomonas phage PaMx25]ALH23818.1 hypothetical protein PaMx25_12 [Pseudomonas phage PaMx25]
MTNKIVEALLKLDVKNDNHWTADGLPRLDTVKMLASDQTLTRDSVAAAAPGFSRTTATGYTTPSAEQQAPQQQGQGGSTEQQQSAAPAAAQTAPQATQATESDQRADDLDAGQAEQPSMEGSAGVATDDIAALEEALAEQEELVTKIRAHKVEVDKAFEEARAKEDELRVKLEEARPQRSTSNDIQDYLAAQRKNLEARAARQQMIRESGINLKELASNLKAPIDAARARRTTRGG